jgi:hypothetical protein
MRTWTVAQSKKYRDGKLRNNEAHFSLFLNLPSLLSLYSSAQHLSYIQIVESVPRVPSKITFLSTFLGISVGSCRVFGLFWQNFQK